MTVPYLIIGGDGLIGRQTAFFLRRNGYKVLTTTRRSLAANKDSVYLDLLNARAFVMPQSVRSVLLAAASVKHTYCEQEPTSYTVNVEAPEILARSLFAKGTFCVFLSTDAVFGGDLPQPEENAPHEPRTAYAKQKHEAETRIVALAEALGKKQSYAIVRLTKVISPDIPPFSFWLDSWERGEPVSPFSDLFFSPISLDYVVRILTHIMMKKTPGIFHLSGSQSLSYADFAFYLAKKMNVSCKLVKKISAKDAGVNLIYTPKYTEISMNKTIDALKIKQQNIDDVVSSFIMGANTHRVGKK